MVEQYGEFLSSLNIDFEAPVTTELNFDLKSAEKYIISLKIQKYIETLEKQKRDLTVRGLVGENDIVDEIRRIDDEIKRMREKFELLV